MSTLEESRQRSKLGGALLWFAVLGGAFAWLLHLLSAWGVNEVACAAGHSEIRGASLSAVLIGTVVVPGAIALASLGLAVVAWLRTSPAGDSRTRLLATVGIWADLLFITMITFDAIAIAMFTPCQT